MQPFNVPPEIEEIAPEADRIAEDLRCVKSLKRHSNIFTVTLLSQQVIAGILAFMIAGLIFLVRTLVLGDRSAGFSLRFVSDTDSVVSNLLVCFIYFSYMFIPLILQAFFLRQNPFRVIPLGAPRNRRMLLPALAAVLAVSGLAALITNYIQFILSFLHLQATSPEGLTLPHNLPAIVLYIAQICVLAPVCEEFLFRGFILQNLRRFGSAFAVFVSAILFAMVHGNLLQMPLAFLVGIALGVLMIEFGSIWVTVLMHCAVNTLSVVIDLMSRFRGENNAGMLYYAVILLALGVCALTFRTRARPLLAARRESYRESPLPFRFMAKKFFLTPGAVCMIAVTVLLAAAYMQIR